MPAKFLGNRPVRQSATLETIWDLWFNKNSSRNKFSLVWGQNYNILQLVARASSDFTCLWARFRTRLGAGGGLQSAGSSTGCLALAWQRHRSPAEPFPSPEPCSGGITWTSSFPGSLASAKSVGFCACWFDLPCFIWWDRSWVVVCLWCISVWLLCPLPCRGSCRCCSAAWMRSARCSWSQTATTSTQM